MSHMSRGFRRMDGLSLVELMITIVLALLVTLGLLTLMNNVGITNRVQDGMARMQENGRYALQRITADLHAGASQYCSNFAVGSGRLGTSGATAGEYFLERGRPIIAHYDVSAAKPNGVAFGPSTADRPALSFSPNNTYLISPRWSLFGTDCDTGTCAPVVNAANRGIDATVFTGLRANMGVNAGNRVRGADTLSIRYLRGPGVRVTTEASNVGPDGIPVSFPVDTTALGVVDTTLGQIFITDCATGEILKMRANAGVMTATSNFSDDVMQRLAYDTDVRAFNLDRDLIQVSYFLQLKDDPDPQRNPANRKIAVLMRSENGTASELVEGVERLDFLYAVDDQFGRTKYLTANQVDAMAADCPDSPATPPEYTPTNNYFGVNEPGCGWRAVKSVEVSMLMNTVTDVSPNGNDAFRYSYTNGGAANTVAGAFEIPSSLGTMRSGLPPYRMLRREFSTQVNVRGYNF